MVEPIPTSVRSNAPSCRRSAGSSVIPPRAGSAHAGSRAVSPLGIAPPRAGAAHAGSRTVSSPAIAPSCAGAPLSVTAASLSRPVRGAAVPPLTAAADRRSSGSERHRRLHPHLELGPLHHHHGVESLHVAVLGKKRAREVVVILHVAH